MTGYVLRDDVLRAVAEGRPEAPASELSRDLLTVPDSLPLPDLFQRLLDRHEHLALVVGEYGGTAGVATVEDVVETLLGLEIRDETDAEDDMQAAARTRWSDRARRMGIVGADPTAAVEQAVAEQKAAVRLGLTGGTPPAAGGSAG